MKLISTFIALLIIGTLSGQVISTKNKRAEKYFLDAQKYFHLRENSHAVDQLKKALKEDEYFSEAMLLMADIYHDLGNDSLQVVYLENASKLGTEHSVKISYVLGNAYYRLGKYRQASDHYRFFLSNSSEKHALYQEAKDKLGNCDFALSLLKDPVEFNAINLGHNINSDFDEYWPSLTIDGKTIVFTRLCRVDRGFQKAERFQEDFFLSNYVDDEWEPAEPVTSINTPSNEGAQSISADGKLLFFTTCTQADGYGSCDIYFSRNKAGAWTKPQNAGAPVNTVAWESQPAISANGEYLYFASNRKGGYGGMDIWRCRLNGFYTSGEPRWSEPQNLGKTINTTGNEMSPFIHADSKTLYFASDKLMGLGGYDIFYSRLINDSVWKTPENMGYPMNTHKDEQGLIVDASGVLAYYSSGRPGSKGLDIYRFELQEKARPTPVSYVQGKVFDKKSGHPLCAQIELIDLDENKLVAKTESAGEKGEFLICLPLGNEYAFNVSRSGYLFYSENFALKQVRSANDPFLLDIPLNAIESGNATVLRNIFFETGKYDLLAQSKAELGKLIDFLNKNPQVKIEIGGHTDNVGDEAYNQELSQNRARSVYDYLIKNGVGASGLSYRGYGYSVPLADNNTADGRTQNRRTEFKVISTD